MCRFSLRTIFTSGRSAGRGFWLPVTTLATAMLLASVGRAEDSNGPRTTEADQTPVLRAPGVAAEPSTGSEAELGEGTSIPPAELESGIPPAPAPARGSSPDSLLPTPDPLVPDSAPREFGREPADAVLQRVQLAFDRGNWRDVIRETSGLLAADPRNEVARQMRGRAYAATGRFEEALADVNPVPAVTTKPATDIMSGRQVLDTLERGTPIEISEARGNWLLVARIGERPAAPGWVHREMLAPREIVTAPDVAGRIPPAPQPLREPVPEPSRGGLQLDIEVPGSATIWRGRHPSRSFFELHLDIGGRSPRHRPYRGSYGREHYDWWRHVPPQFRQFLPR